jgi:membrane associated rhomboid family serine protease
MAYRNTTYPPGSYDRVGQGVKWLLISNIAIFLLMVLSPFVGAGSLWRIFALVPSDVFGHFAVWQVVTYMFLHDSGDFWHILFNMLSLWMFGADLERTWGTREFLKYYFICGVGAGLCILLANLIFPAANPDVPTIGASGAIFGLLLAFGYLWPDRQILFSFLFPIKAKYFVMIFGAIAFLSSIRGTGGGVSHIAHLGGMVIGFLYLRNLKRSRRPAYARASMSDTLRQRYKEWKIQRARRKFEVYMRKKENDRDRFVH